MRRILPRASKSAVPHYEMFIHGGFFSRWDESTSASIKQMSYVVRCAASTGKYDWTTPVERSKPAILSWLNVIIAHLASRATALNTRASTVIRPMRNTRTDYEQEEAHLGTPSDIKMLSLDD